MILVLGGTKEGREIADFLAEKALEVILSVTTPLAQAFAKEHTNHPFEVHVGKLDTLGLDKFIETRKIQAVVDATHPFAEEITRAANSLCKGKNIPYLLYQRASTPYGEDVKFTSDFIQGAKVIPTESKVFAAIGVRHLQEFLQAGNFKPENVFVRVLPSSFEECKKIGIPEANIITGVGPYTVEDNLSHFKTTGAKWLVTKASGPTGGEAEKIQAAFTLGMQVIVIKRPENLSDGSCFSKAEILERLRGITMKPGLIILAHGSKRKETKDTLAGITAMVKAQGKYSAIAQAYLQFCQPTLEDAVHELTEQGFKKIVVVPYFLFKGVHNTEDIPAELDKLKGENPELEIVFAEPLGVDKRLAEIILERAQEASPWNI